MKKNLITQVLFILSLLCTPSLAQFGSSSPFANNLLTYNDGEITGNSTKIYDFIGNGVEVTYSSTTNRHYVTVAGGASIPYDTVANLPGSPSAGDLAGVTDGNADDDCTTGGGSTYNLCQYTGSAWTIVGDGTSASGADNVSIDGSAVTDPDFVSTADIDFIDTSNTVTAEINENVVDYDNIKYNNTLAGNPAMAVDECFWMSTTSGACFICEGSTANTNEQLYCFPDVDGADTTEYLLKTSDTSVTDNAITRFDGTNGVTTQGYTSNAPTCDDTGNCTFGQTISGSIDGNAATATALTANGANCSAGSAPLGVDASGAAESCTDFEEDLSNEAGLYAALSDVSDFVQTDEVNSIDSDMYVDGSIDSEHMGATFVTGLTAVGTFSSGDTFICNEAGVGIRECDYDDLPAGGGSGDVTGVGDCADGACLDGSSDGGTYIRLYDGDSHYGAFVTANIAANRTYTFGNLDLTFDQSVASGASPTFDGTNFTGIPAGSYDEDGIDDDDISNSADVMSGSFGITIDGGGSAITTGVKGYVEVPYAMTIDQATFLCDQSGSIVVDVWKDTYANYPPTDADSITASAPPTITTATKSQDTTLTGWTTSVTAEDIIGFNVDSASTVTRCHLIISGNKT